MLEFLLGVYLGGIISYLMTYWIYRGKFILYRDWIDRTLVLETFLWPIALPIGALKELKGRRNQ